MGVRIITEQRTEISKSNDSPKEKGKQTEKDELVLTPGGWRPKSKVHHVGPGQHVDVEDGRLKIIDTATGKIIEDLGEIQETETTRQKNIQVLGHGEKKKQEKKK
jgi:hypothetical protein